MKCEVFQSGLSLSRSIYPWHEWYPAKEVKITNLAINPGDLISMLITTPNGSGSTTATISFGNQTSGVFTSYEITAPAGTVLAGNCAEWIVETPIVNNVLTQLPDYGEIFFSECVGYLTNGTLVNGGTGNNINLVQNGRTESIGTLITPTIIQCQYNGSTLHLDLFATGPGTVWSTWWEDLPSWQPSFSIWNNLQTMQPGATVTALWRSNDTHLDLFVTGPDGTVWSTWWEDQPGWQPWSSMKRPDATGGNGHRALAVNDTHLDLFVTGPDGTVWSTWWEAPGWQQPWFPICNNVLMQPGATVTALWRSNDTHLDLFVTGPDGTVWSTWWRLAKLATMVLNLEQPSNDATGGNGHCAWRSNDTHLDLFVTGPDGTVWSTWWEAPGWQQPWFPIWNNVLMQPGATVTALWRSNNTHLDLFVTGPDGTVWSTWWEDLPSWQPWFSIWNNVLMQPGATVTALWRSNDTHLDLFVTGPDGTVWSTWWEDLPSWQPWFSIWNNVLMQPGATVTALWR